MWRRVVQRYCSLQSEQGGCAAGSICSLKRSWLSTAESSMRSTTATGTSPTTSSRSAWNRLEESIGRYLAGLGHARIIRATLAQERCLDLARSDRHFILAALRCIRSKRHHRGGLG